MMWYPRQGFPMCAVSTCVVMNGSHILVGSSQVSFWCLPVPATSVLGDTTTWQKMHWINWEFWGFPTVVRTCDSHSIQGQGLSYFNKQKFPFLPACYCFKTAKYVHGWLLKLVTNKLLAERTQGSCLSLRESNGNGVTRKLFVESCLSLQNHV